MWGDLKGGSMSYQDRDEVLLLCQGALSASCRSSGGGSGGGWGKQVGCRSDSGSPQVSVRCIEFEHDSVKKSGGCEHISSD